jgi:hypothetical protein
LKHFLGGLSYPDFIFESSVSELSGSWMQRLTGGLVIWRSGSAAVVYRGKDYVHPFVREREEREERERRKLLSLGVEEDDEREQVTDALEAGSKEELEPLKEKEDLDSTEDMSADENLLEASGQSMESGY